MRRAFIAITLMGASLYTSAGELADFAVKQAHAKSFTGCDAAIKKTHEFATGGDIRVNVMSFDETPNSLTMTSTWGTKGDSLYGKTVFTKVGKKCVYDSIVIITSPKTCFAYAQDNPAFSYVAEAADYLWFKNAGGINMQLAPVSNGCIAVFNPNGIM
ncbi:hypothetical protein [Stutzerimonas chloritidismutans]|uniref:hypothetical protein n=1 Tax=Stutzerimonas chloritidismutans TaxID=203192 RepID=UPI001D188E1E|nr:hypothetical protein [Stutzerimonas chloritidismutans]UEG63288.1 hypothetical protein LLJ08_09205 [Stutzerimonas chloritidismutans]